MIYSHNIHFGGRLIDYANSPNIINSVDDVHLEMAVIAYPSGNVIFYGTPLSHSTTLSSSHLNHLFFKLKNRLRHQQQVNSTTMTISDLNNMALNIRGTQYNVDDVNRLMIIIQLSYSFKIKFY